MMDASIIIGFGVIALAGVVDKIIPPSHPRRPVAHRQEWEAEVSGLGEGGSRADRVWSRRKWAELERNQAAANSHIVRQRYAKPHIFSIVIDRDDELCVEKVRASGIYAGVEMNPRWRETMPSYDEQEKPDKTNPLGQIRIHHPDYRHTVSRDHNNQAPSEYVLLPWHRDDWLTTDQCVKGFRTNGS